jgi:hypothetical protein
LVQRHSVKVFHKRMLSATFNKINKCKSWVALLFCAMMVADKYSAITLFKF